MRYTRMLKLGGLAAAIGLTFAAPAGPTVPVKTALARAFPEATVTSQWTLLSSNQVERLKTAPGRERVPGVLQLYTAWSNPPPADPNATTNGAVAGYAVVHTVPGKHGPIRLLVATTPQLGVVRTEIISFQERRGRAVQQQSFLSQFVGKTPDDELALRADIDAITGATVSSGAVARGVREALRLLSEMTVAAGADTSVRRLQE